MARDRSSRSTQARASAPKVQEKTVILRFSGTAPPAPRFPARRQPLEFFHSRQGLPSCFYVRMRIHRAYSRFHQGAFRSAEVRPACQWVSFFSSCRVMVCWLNRAFRARASISSGGDCCKELGQRKGQTPPVQKLAVWGFPVHHPAAQKEGCRAAQKGQTPGEPAPRGAIRGASAAGRGSQGWLLGGFRCYCRLVGGGLPICRVGVRLGLRSCGRFTVEGGGYAVRRSGLQGNPTHTQAVVLRPRVGVSPVTSTQASALASTR